MQKPQHILVIANDDTIRNLLEQFFIIRDIKVATTRTLQQAEHIIDSWGLAPFNLAIIDTAAFGNCESEQKSMACHMLREWSMKYPSVSILFLGNPYQKRAILKIRADIVQCLVKPFNLETLIDTINDLYPNLRPADFTSPPAPNAMLIPDMNTCLS
ncbi:MAG: hypothetical protein ETSY1_28980 [Candidatus Entotheonella factor]|uniref:Response regulatory domain-containing protein n=1 Tax=Entotheonella factor TaxID=1429438 RepID=W4LCP8_ENTF1|nr:MAG: hypothetical protein ETSY1_28980 [Candidatus Entotheonella factor]